MWIVGLKGIVTMQPLVIEGRMIFCSRSTKFFVLYSEQSFYATYM